MLIYETENFLITTPEQPELSRKDGGQVDIEEKHCLEDRLMLTPKQEAELSFYRHLVATAYIKVMRQNGVPIVRINYQDNGNWCYFAENGKPQMHLHIYGRIFNSEKQPLPQSLYFPDPYKCADFYDLEPLTQKDIEDLKLEMERLLQTEEFDKKRWYL